MELTLTKLPWYAQVGAFVALAGTGVGVFFYYYEMPARADMASREPQLIALRGDINKGLNAATCVATTFVLLDKPQAAKPGGRGAAPATAPAAAPAKGA